ncbi:glycosyltransferase family 2 protein [Psychroflexus aestuariivivens]|uniref:glycosyltransferase family 2 protein n=1 Tax=Psychroflexus aestuariivivens TaxID=1795040 RepID=UPI000FD77488|nr:glycosyltransferase [Psychroflexus aestuariivivens]
MADILFYIISFFFLIYGLSLLSWYFAFIILAKRSIKRNKRKEQFLEVEDISSATDIPTVSLIAPAFNEGKTIVSNVKSLLSIQYPFYELIVVNDGSSDDSLEKLISTFELESQSIQFFTESILTAEVRGLYKSKNPQYKQITVIDKANGGRADAINAGINFASSELVLCTDADCIIEQDAILKMVRPFLEETNREVIASGAGIGIVNDSEIKNGILKQLKVPKSYLTRVQVVEYIRAFLLGRMAWSRVNGLMLVSGAFGMFPRNRLVEVGGYDNKTVGEDFELCVRMRKHMEDLNLPYKLVYIPETLCWTESPSSWEIFAKQRDRWARGLWETLFNNREITFNSKYGKMGRIYLPFWWIYEFGAPIIEFLGLIIIIVFSIFGWINWEITLLLFLFAYILGCIFSTTAIYMYTKNFPHYNKFSQVGKLLIAAYLEPFLFHPIMLFAQIKGYYKKIFKIESGWGTMTRKGFDDDEDEEKAT